MTATQMPGTGTLTERYVAAAAARVSERQRTDLCRELAERIADTIDAKAEEGMSPGEAEYATLSELGDPEILAATYLDRPLHLIGPQNYPLWRRLVRLLAPLVAILAAAGATIGNVLAGTSAGEAILDALATASGAAIYTAAGITVIFAVTERIGTRSGAPGLAGIDGFAWRPERLPQVTEPGLRLDQAIDLVVLAGVAVLVFFANQMSSLRVDGEWLQMPFINPETWRWLRWAWLALIGAKIVLTIARLTARRRTWPQVVADLAIAVAVVAVTLPPLVSGQLVNPALFEVTGWASGVAHFVQGGVGVTIGVFVVIICAFGDAIEAFFLTFRAQRHLA